jgi:hypothetical protein
MFTWLFHVKDDNYKERPHKFTDEEIKEFMSRIHIDSDELKEIVKDLEYEIKEGKLFLSDRPEPRLIKGNEDDTYNICDNCYEIISLDNENPEEHLQWCMNDMYGEEIYISEEIMARTMGDAIEKISEYLKENLPIPEELIDWDFGFSCAESSPCWDGGSIDFNVKGVEGYELRMIFHHPDYNSEEFESWDEEELNELKMEINKSADKWASRY